MTDKLHQAIDKALQEHAVKVAEAREQAVEAMLQQDQGGVLEIQHTDGSAEFFVTDSVPYGSIYQWAEALAGPFLWQLPEKDEPEV